MKKFFYYFTGADVELLKLSTADDRQRYFTLGVEVSLLCLLNFVFATYALGLVLSDPSDTGFLDTLKVYMTAASLAGCWSFIVMNFYRLVISSTGVGDGSPQITTSEFLSMIPKLIIAIMIAVTTAVPMCVWILRTEISDVSKVSYMSESIDQYKERVDQQYEQRLTALYIDRVMALDNIQNSNQDGMSVEQGRTDLEKANSAIAAVRSEMAQQVKLYEQNVVASASLISSAVRVAHLHKTFFYLVIMFMVLIHLIPLFLRANWVKGAYEYLVAFQDDLVMKKYGITKNHTKFYDNYIARYSIPEKILASEKAKYRNTRRMLNDALKKWKDDHS